MRIDGEWLPCNDGVVRPVVRGEMLANDGTWRAIRFLVDTGADSSLLSAAALELLQLPSQPCEDSVGGIGGFVDSVRISAQLRLLRDDGRWASFRGEYRACTEYQVLDMSVLGRDILNMFAVIIDRPANLVAIIGQAHTYTINKQ